MQLSEALSKYENEPFEYGKLDCFLFVCNVIRDVSGIDYATPWRGKYHSEAGALREIARYGGFVDAMTAAFGKVRPIWSVRTGDPVLLSREMAESDSIGNAIGLYDGSVIRYMADGQLCEAPIMAGRGCWRV